MTIRTVRRLHSRLLIHTAGGPAANLFSIVCTIPLFDRSFSDLGRSTIGSLAAQFAVFSLLAVLVNLTPFRLRSGLLSDGARIKMLLCSRNLSRRWISIEALAKTHHSGVRPRDWKRTWIKSASSLRDTSLESFLGNWLAYASANDRNEVTVAASHLETCLELAPLLSNSIRDLVAQEATYFAAWFQDDADLAARWRSQLKIEKRTRCPDQLRLNVAIACAQRDYDAAERYWFEGFNVVEHSSSGAAQERLTEGWNEWREEILRRKNGAVALSGPSR
jgi:hypothetical protein